MIIEPRYENESPYRYSECLTINDLVKDLFYNEKEELVAREKSIDLINKYNGFIINNEFKVEGECEIPKGLSFLVKLTKNIELYSYFSTFLTDEHSESSISKVATTYILLYDSLSRCRIGFVRAIQNKIITFDEFNLIRQYIVNNHKLRYSNEYVYFNNIDDFNNFKDYLWSKTLVINEWIYK